VIPPSLQHLPWHTFGKAELRGSFEEKVAAVACDQHLLKYQPRLSFGCLFSRADDLPFLRCLVDSLQAQTYADWELKIVGEGVVPAETRFADRRIENICADLTGAQAAERALCATSGTWFGWLPRGMLLSPVALQAWVIALQSEGGADLLFSHQARFEGSHARGLFFQNAHSPFSLWHGGGPGHLWLGRKEQLEAVGGFAQADGSGYVHGLMLRLSAVTRKFHLVPWVLGYVDERAELPLEPPACPPERIGAHLRETGVPASVRLNGEGVIEILPLRAGKALTGTVVIPFRDRGEMTAQAVQSLGRQTGGVQWDLLLLDNQSTPAERARVEKAAAELGWPWRVVSYPHSFNYAAMNNSAVLENSVSDLVVLLNNDVTLESPSALEEMAAWGALEWVGTVGIQLAFPSGGVQHAGLGVARRPIDGQIEFVHVHLPAHLAARNREVLASTFAAVLIRRAVYTRLGGLRALDYPNAHSDTAFCLGARRQGLANLYLGSVRGVHAQSASRGARYEGWEFEQLCNEFPDLIREALVGDLRWQPLSPNWVERRRTQVRRWVAETARALALRFPQLEPWVRRVPRLGAVLSHHG